jgi:hypothetical protein
MVPHPKLAEPEDAESVFALFDNAESLTGNLASILDARRQAGGCGLVPYAKASGTG